MAEEISFLYGVDVRIAEEGGATVVGIPIGTEEYLVDRAVGIVRVEAQTTLALCLADMPDK